jgi:hypothetical protein
MGALAKLFGPIVEYTNVDLDKIHIVAFDTDGTLVNVERKGYTQIHFTPDNNIADLFRLLHDNKDTLGLEEVVIISGDAARAESLLEKAGLRPSILEQVEDKISFYKRAREKNILAVDDDVMAAMLAKAYMNPKAERVQKHLNEESSRRGMNLS